MMIREKQSEKISKLKLPGDELVPSPRKIITHSIIINAAANAVWPWLLQLGSGRAGWYSFDKIDNGGIASSEKIIPELQNISKGDILPAVPGTKDAFIVREIIPEKALVLVVPIQNAIEEPDINKRMNGKLRVSWVLALEALGENKTRLISRGRISREWLAPSSGASVSSKRPIFIERVYKFLSGMPWFLISPIAMLGHSIMESRMLRGIKKRSEIKIMLASFMLLILAGCKSYFLSDDFESKTINHKTVAVLPFEMVFSGLKPQKLSDEDLRIIEEGESKAFMISLHNEILRSTNGGKKPIRVNVQHYDKTLSILKENNIDLRSSWNEDPGKLAKMLGVDAVVKTRVEKFRYMSDLTSYGIDLGVHILAILSDYKIYQWLPPNLARSKKVKSSCSLLDKEGVNLWSITYDIDADWTRPSNEIIDNINRKSARRFPYRIKK